MGEVIVLRAQRRGEGAPSREGEAQILLFTGVRYQRDDSAPASAPSQPPAHGARRSGKLGDGRPRPGA